MNYFFQKRNRQNQQRGQAILIVVIMCTAIFLTIVLGTIEPIVNELRLSTNLLRSKSSLYTAESGAEDSIYRLKNNLISNYATPIIMSLNGFFATSTITDLAGVKTISTTGSDSRSFRKVETKVVTGEGADFYYGVQAGTGGLSLAGGSIVNGNVYSNGTVDATGGSIVTGSIIAANPSVTVNATVGGGGNASALTVGASGVGDVWAHNVVGATVAGTIYCQTSNKTNKSCNTSRADPPQQDFPIPDSLIQTFKSNATSSIHTGNYTVSTSTTLGPLKITGNLVVSGGTLTLSGTVWVQGNVTFTSGAHLRLVADYGGSGGVLITDGLVVLTGNSDFGGSGVNGSYPMILTTSSSTSAMTVSGGSGGVVLVAQSGTFNISGGTSARALSAKRIVITGGGQVTYDSGLANYNFISGPSGGWNISSWKEVE